MQEEWLCVGIIVTRNEAKNGNHAIYNRCERMQESYSHGPPMALLDKIAPKS